MLLALSAAFIFGCKKDDDNTNDGGTNNTKAALIKTWQSQSVVAYDVNSVIKQLPIYARGGSANLYDFGSFSVTFKSDGTFQRNDLDGANTTGTWALASDNKTITMTSTSGAVLKYSAESVTDKTATFKYILNVKNPTGIDAQIIDKAKSLGSPVQDGAYLNLVVTPK